MSFLYSLILRLYRFFSSFLLATLVLSGLLFITYIGTISQVERGLLDSQHIFFDSWWICEDWKLHINGQNYLIPYVFPGGQLLMVLLFTNMLCGAVIHIRKGWRTIGVLISHLAIMFMLVAGWVSLAYKKEGAMPLMEGQTSNQFQSYHERIIEIRKYNSKDEGEPTAQIIPMKHFEQIPEKYARTFFSQSLPFEIQVQQYYRNANIAKTTPDDKSNIDGFKIKPTTLNTQDEANTSALVIKILDPTQQTTLGQAILWEGALHPYTLKIGDSSYTFTLGRMKWNLPFAIKLNDFIREVHPGTQKAKRYTSHITKISTDGTQEPRVVTMNVPVRDQGFVVYQASFSQSQNGEQSVFTVASNPSDQWPLWSCLAVACGLCLHFIMMLIRFLRRQTTTKIAQ
jgi:hypothetical protein